MPYIFFADYLSRELEQAYGLLPMGHWSFIQQDASEKPMLSMPQVILQPSSEDSLDKWRRIRDADNTFLLLKPADMDEYVSAQTAKNSWLAMCAGASDCWDLNNEDLDTESRYSKLLEGLICF